MARSGGAEKVLFTSVDVNALGILLEEDAGGHAAVVRSMLTPLQVEAVEHLPPLHPGAKAGPQHARVASGRAALEVGDVLFAVNGQLVHERAHKEVLGMLRVDALTAESEMLVLSFLDPSAYYAQVKAGTLVSRAMTDPALYGRMHAGGWRAYLPTWSLFRGSQPPAHGPEIPAPSQHAANGLGLHGALPGSANAASAAAYAAAAAAAASSSSPPSALSASSSSSSSAGGGSARIESRGQSEAARRFNAGEFQQALAVYTSVLERDPLSHTVRVSRSLCYLRLGEPEAALKDALTCCALKPEWPMAYVCKGAALDAMGNPMEACSAYVCGLVVDPSNVVLRQRLNALFDRMGWTCVALDGKHVVGSVASAVMQREEWGSDLLVDRIVLYSSSQVCLSQVAELAPDLALADISGPHGAVAVRVPDPARCAQLLEEGKLLCELFHNDQVLTANSNPVKNSADLFEQVLSSDGVVVLGILSGARIAATQLLEKEYAAQAEEALSSVHTPTLFTICVDGAGLDLVNGVYVPQEHRNDEYVFENAMGVLLTMERVRGPAGWVHGWVLGRDGQILYTGTDGSGGASSRPWAEDDDVSGRQSSTLMSDNCKVFNERMQRVRWRCCTGASPAPSRVKGASQVPWLGFFMGDEDNAATGNNNELAALDLDSWSAGLQILAIKGYGNRALARNDLDMALNCFDVVVDQAEALLEGDSENSGLSLTSDEDDEAQGGAGGADIPRAALASGSIGQQRPVTLAKASDSFGSSLRGNGQLQLSSRADKAGSSENGAGPSSPVGLDSALAALDAGVDSARDSYLNEKASENDRALMALLAKVLLGKSQALLEQGSALEARNCAARAGRIVDRLGLGGCALAGFRLAMAEAAAGNLEAALAACRSAVPVTGTALAQKLAGLEEELKRQRKVHRESISAVGPASPATSQSMNEGDSEVQSPPANAEANGGEWESDTALKRVASLPHKVDTSGDWAGADPLDLDSILVRPMTPASAPSPALDPSLSGLRKGLKLKRHTVGRAGAAISKSKIVACSADGTRLLVSPASRTKEILGIGNKPIQRSKLRGVVRGRLAGQSTGSTGAMSPRPLPDPCSLTIVSADPTEPNLVLSAPSPRECDAAIDLLASWLSAP